MKNSFKKMCLVAFTCFSLSSCALFNVEYETYYDNPSEHRISYYLSKSSVDLRVGDTHKLILYYGSPSINPTTGEERGHVFPLKVNWKTNDSKVAAISSNGTITAKGEGTTYVKAVVRKDIEVSCYVTVTNEQIGLIEFFTRYGTAGKDAMKQDVLMFERNTTSGSKKYSSKLYYYKNSQNYPFTFQVEEENGDFKYSLYSMFADENSFLQGSFMGSTQSNKENVYGIYYFDATKIKSDSKNQTLSIDKNDLPTDSDDPFDWGEDSSFPNEDQIMESFNIVNVSISHFNKVMKEHNNSSLKLF